MQVQKIILLLFSIFLISLVSAGSCNEPGYTYCWENSYDWYDAHAYAKVFYSIKDEGSSGGINEGYPVGRLFVDVGFEGDNLYYIQNMILWDHLLCNEGGCYDISPCGESCGFYDINPGEHTLANLHEEYTHCPIFLAWDRDDSGGYWAWTTAGYGWLGDGDCFNWKVVECYDDSDCFGEQVCDKSGNWREWNCVQAECQGEETKCDDMKLVTCEDGEWGTGRYVIGKCGVECLSINDCPNSLDYGCGGYKCILVDEYEYYRLENNQCTPILLLPSEVTGLDFVTLEECEDAIDTPTTYYRIQNNICVEVTLLPEEVTENDYNTLAACKDNLIYPPCNTKEDCKEYAKVTCDDGSLWYHDYLCIDTECIIDTNAPPKSCVANGNGDIPFLWEKIIAGILVFFVLIGIIILIARAMRK